MLIDYKVKWEVNNMDDELYYDDAEENDDSYDPDYFDDKDAFYISSSTAKDYSPSNPWDAPGMSIKDFI